jgi:hypothetical protein
MRGLDSWVGGWWEYGATIWRAPLARGDGAFIAIRMGILGSLHCGYLVDVFGT